ncbi:MAG: hypothetical protein GWP15_02365 [Nitrospirae bacterium]|nr:hypothetical protein [Nitrospirota bacterium]
MMFKLSRYLFFIGLFSLMSVTAFAEGDVVCSGRVMGSTTNFNANFGELYFDSHGAPAGGIPVGYENKYDQVVDVSIVGGTTGLAPADRADAACVSEEVGDYFYGEPGPEFLLPYEYKLEGYAWSDNLGFINFLGDEAGYEDYGVKIGLPDGGGIRQLFGYAWSGSGAGPAFGYIQFKGRMADSTPYGVTMDSTTGMLSGYAWSDAGIWIDFTGIQIELPDAEVPIATEGICGGVEYLCVDVSIHEEVNDYWYDLEVYLMEDDGVTPLDLTTYDLAVDFVWEDTIKLNQLAYSRGPAGGDFDEIAYPVNSGGGILAKPLSVANSNEFLKLFQEVGVKTGHYQLKEKIKSLAPTSGSNVSLTTSTLPPLAIKNEFFADELSIGGDVWTDDIEPNELILKRIDYDITKGGVPVTGDIVYPGGLGSGYRFEFAPVIDVGVLYAGNHEDTIIGFRNVPISFTMKESHTDYLKYSDAEVYVMLAYDETETVSECSDTGYDSFDYYFTDEGLDAIALEHAGHGDWSFTSIVPNPYASAVKFALGDLANEQVYNAVATLIGYDPEDPNAGLPCDVIQGPTLYTVVKYLVPDESKDPIYYYSNKIPRILSAAYNPAAIIHGNVYAPKAFSPTASHETQETGYLAVNVVRNTINENINKYLGDIELTGGGACEVLVLTEEGDSKITCAGGEYRQFEVGDEHVLYFKETEVTLDMGVPGADSNFLGNWVIIVKDAPVFIDSDLYHKIPADGNLVLISMSTYDGSCDVNNIYLHSDVKNIDANIVADCSLFPYHPAVAMPGADGVPDWTFEEKIEYLDNQKLFRGSIASRNTIGGADLDSLAGKEYLLFGTGEVAELPVDLDTRLDAQNYDFNYMAFFMLSVEMSDNGWPIDQRCQKALTIDDMVAINEGGYVEGENGEQCDGIDLAQFDPNTLDGDLVVAEDDFDKLARGLGAFDFNPIYIYATSSGSFVFEKSGEVTSWN